MRLWDGPILLTHITLYFFPMTICLLLLHILSNTTRLPARSWLIGVGVILFAWPCHISIVSRASKYCSRVIISPYLVSYNAQSKTPFHACRRGCSSVSVASEVSRSRISPEAFQQTPLHFPGILYYKAGIAFGNSPRKNEFPCGVLK